MSARANRKRRLRAAKKAFAHQVELAAARRIQDVVKTKDRDIKAAQRNSDNFMHAIGGELVVTFTRRQGQIFSDTKKTTLTMKVWTFEDFGPSPAIAREVQMMEDTVMTGTMKNGRAFRDHHERMLWSQLGADLFSQIRACPVANAILNKTSRWW